MAEEVARRPLAERADEVINEAALALCSVDPVQKDWLRQHGYAVKEAEATLVDDRVMAAAEELTTAFFALQEAKLTVIDAFLSLRLAKADAEEASSRAQEARLRARAPRRPPPS